MNNSPLISCIITVGDNFKYLEDAIYSVLNQKYNNPNIIKDTDGLSEYLNSNRFMPAEIWYIFLGMAIFLLIIESTIIYILNEKK